MDEPYDENIPAGPRYEAHRGKVLLRIFLISCVALAIGAGAFKPSTIILGIAVNAGVSMPQQLEFGLAIFVSVLFAIAAFRVLTWLWPRVWTLVMVEDDIEVPDTQDPIPTYAPPSPPPEPAPEPLPAQAYEPEEAPPPRPTVSQSTMTEPQRADMLRYLSGALKAVRMEVASLDDYVTFALWLAIGGAAERYAANAGLDDASAQVMVQESVAIIGGDTGRVAAFAHAFDDYRITAQGATMIDVGGRAMGRHLAGDSDAFTTFAVAVARWAADADNRTFVDLSGIV